MKLYGSYTSPFVRHCRIALAQEGFDYEFIEADYAMSARQSPTAKVPYFSDAEINLTDSSSILKYVREKAGNTFLQDIQQFELFALTNTLLDATVNLFLLENEGYGPEQIKYLKRQQNRIDSGLNDLNSRIDDDCDLSLDGSLRLACYIDWALFRNRINTDNLSQLNEFLTKAKTDSIFNDTAPPAS